MEKLEDDKYALPGGCLVFVLLMGFILWTFVGCLKREPRADDRRDSGAEVRAKLDTPELRASAADIVRGEGYWCESPTYLGPRSWTGQIDANRLEFRLECQGGGRTANYGIVMDPDTNQGYVIRE